MTYGSAAAISSVRAAAVRVVNGVSGSRRLGPVRVRRLPRHRVLKLGANSHAYSYVHPAIYGLTFVAALRGVSVAVGSWRSPGTASGRAMNIGLAVLLALTLWAGAATLLARAYTA